MDKIWDRKSFEVGGHWPFRRDESQNRQKSNGKKCFIKNGHYYSSSVQYVYTPYTSIMVVSYEEVACKG